MKSIIYTICLLLILSPISAQSDLGFGQVWNRISDDPLFFNIGDSPNDWNGKDAVSYFTSGRLLQDGDTLKFYIGATNGTGYSIGMWYSTQLDSGWQEYPGNPVMRGTPGAWDSLHVSSPFVMKDGDTYRMWYMGAQDDDDLGRFFYSLGYATSQDGIHWTKHPDPVIETGADIDPNHRGVYSPYVIKDGDTLKMWYCSANVNPGHDVMEYAYSFDGITWTKPMDTPIMDPGLSPDNWIFGPVVKKIDGQYKMWYCNGSGGYPYPASTYFAISEDGINWRKDDLYNPVFPANTNNFWEDVGVGFCDIIEENGAYFALYGAWRSDGRGFPIGLAKYSPTTIPAGNVTGTWMKAGSPYLVEGEITVPDGQSLTIEPGVTVEFLNHNPLNVQGQLLAEGVQGNKIRFMVDDTLGFHDYAATEGVWGGIRFDSTSASNDSSILTHCEIAFARTFAGDGGGKAFEGKGGGGLSIYKFDKVRVENCLIQYNQAIGDVPSIHAFGGGINIQQYSSPVIMDNLIQHNTAMHLHSDKESQGGGIWVYQYSDPLVAGNTIRWNRTSDTGGGLGVWWDSDPMIINNLIIENHAGLNVPGWGAGGGVSSGWDAVPVFMNNTIANNTANWTGGGIYTREASPIFINTIISGNSDQSDNGALGDQVGNAIMAGYTLRLYNSAVEDGVDHFYWWKDVLGMVEWVQSLDADPGIGWNYKPTLSSPVLGTGTQEVTIDGATYYAPDVDLEGNVRPSPLGSNPDMGCYEHQMAGPVMSSTWHWVDYPNNPVLQRGAFGSWDANITWSHDVIWDDGLFKMWYAGHSGSAGPWSIGYATSENGKSWTKYANNPVLTGDATKWYGSKLWNPRVVKVDSVYHMYFGSAGAKVTGHATSSDGINWTFTADPVLEVGGTTAWDGKQVSPIDIMVDTSGYRMWYNGYSVNDVGAVGLATSDDGITWTKHSNNPILERSADGKWDSDPTFYAGGVVYNGKFYYMFYSGNDGTKYNQIGRAYSLNGEYWSRVTKDAPEVPHGPVGSWNDDACFYPSVVLNNGEYHMWYNGTSTADPNNWRIGYARWEHVVIETEEMRALTPNRFSMNQNYPNPFNPITQIRYSLPQLSDVRLVVYDMLGCEIAELVNTEQGVGNYEIQWNGLNQYGEKMPTGVYFARLTAGKQSEVIKMLLLK